MAASAADQTKQTGSATLSGGPVGFVVSVLGGMHLGGFAKRITGQAAPPHIGNRRREELRAAGVQINRGNYRLPDIPGTKANEALYTSTNRKVIDYYKAWVRAGKPALYPKATTPDTMTGSVGVGVLPSVPPFIANLPNTLPGVGSVAARILGPLIVAGLFWPSSTSATDTIYGNAIPRPKATPGGRTRGRRGRRAIPRPRPVAIPKPRAGTPKILSNRRVSSPAQVIEDIQLGGSVTPPLAIPSSSSSSAPLPRQNTTVRDSQSPFPGTSPWPSSAPATPTTPATSPWAKVGQIVGPYIGGLISPLLSPGAQSLPRTQLATQTATDPLTQFNAAAVPFAASQAQTRDCSCAQTKKRRKKGCTNPVTSRTHRTRGGRKFVTVTRRIECQASSRKKPSLRLR